MLCVLKGTEVQGAYRREMAMTAEEPISPRESARTEPAGGGDAQVPATRADDPLGVVGRRAGEAATPVSGNGTAVEPSGSEEGTGDHGGDGNGEASNSDGVVYVVESVVAKPPVSDKKRAANARNGKRGGPKTNAGKLRSSRNSIKTGFGCAVHQWGGGGRGSQARCEIQPDGSVAMKCGTQDIGTGTRTIVAMVTAETLGLPVSALDLLFMTGPAAPRYLERLRHAA